MVIATFRFHQELGAFLPRERRGCAFAVACAHRATTKHMIEALGVPHTEVALVLVNGQDSDFEHLLEEGDDVAVFARRDGRARNLPREPVQFVADAHLGALARLLRMAGYDTLYDNHYHDNEVERLALDDDRIVLTRDRELLKRRTIAAGCYLHALDPEAQLRELVGRLDLAQGARPFSLCLHCNLPLREVDKAQVLERLPPSVRASHERFTTCDGCGRVYWQGSHHKRMAALLEQVGQQGGAPLDGAEVESTPTHEHPSRA